MRAIIPKSGNYKCNITWANGMIMGPLGIALNGLTKNYFLPTKSNSVTDINITNRPIFETYVKRIT